MNCKITADSTCDLGPALLEQYQIALTPLYVTKGDQTFRDLVDIFPDDIYAHVAAGGELCSTAAVNVADYIDFFTALRKEYDAVIHVCLSAEMSSCYQNACLAAAEVDGVWVVDSANLSTGHGHVVLRAAELAAAGQTPEAIVETLHALVPKVRASFVMEQLEYMRKGGRCSSVAALGANLLKLKPSIEVRDGKMGVAKKYRGSMEKCLRDYVADQLAQPETIDPHRLFITHSGIGEELVQVVRQAVAERMDFEEVHVTHAGCTICSHCGYGTLGILYIEK